MQITRMYMDRIVAIRPFSMAIMWTISTMDTSIMFMATMWTSTGWR